MSYKISKELFEEVMNVSLYDELYIDNDFDEYNCVEIEDWQIIKYNNTWIPLDTFVFKCKEWALEQSYMIVIFNNGYFIYDINELYDPMEQLDQWSEDGLSNSEQQAVFDACTYILNNKDKQ